MRTRLEMPILFRAQSAALGVIKAHSLFPIGAQVEHDKDGSGPYWRIVIYTQSETADAVVQFLLGRMPGIRWTRSEWTP